VEEGGVGIVEDGTTIDDDGLGVDDGVGVDEDGVGTLVEEGGGGGTLDEEGVGFAIISTRLIQSVDVTYLDCRS
jgi:hypothetical protein